MTTDEMRAIYRSPWPRIPRVPTSMHGGDFVDTVPVPPPAEAATEIGADDDGSLDTAHGICSALLYAAAIWTGALALYVLWVAGQ